MFSDALSSWLGVDVAHLNEVWNLIKGIFLKKKKSQINNKEKL